jgi:cell division protein FtsL
MKKESKRANILNSARSTIGTFVLTTMVIGAIVYLIWQRNTVDSVMKDIDSLTYKVGQIDAEKARLKRQITALKSFKRIKTLAEDKFNLEPPKSTPVLIVVNNQRYSSAKEKLRLALIEKYNVIEAKQVKKAGF